MKYETDKGILIEEYDYADNPREEFDYFSTFYTFLRDKLSPDANIFSFEEWLRSIFSGKMTKDILSKFENDDISTSTAAQFLCFCLKTKGYIGLPVWKEEHGNVHYFAGFECSEDNFDTCFAGIIFCKKEAIYHEYQKRCSKNIIEKVYDLFKAEVELYSNWANGDVFIYHFADSVECSGPYYGDISTNGVLENLGIKEYRWIE